MSQSQFRVLQSLDIDSDDPFGDGYRHHFRRDDDVDGVVDTAQYATATAPPLVRPQFSNGPAPTYREAVDLDVDFNERSLVEQDLGGHQQHQRQQYERFSTPELEGNAAYNDEKSFDGPAEPEDYHHHGQATPRRPYARRYDHEQQQQQQSETPRTNHHRKRMFVADDDFDEKMGLGGGDAEDEPLNPHFGSAPTVQLRRNRTKKRVALSNGNLVIDAPIPSRLSGFLPRKGQEEFDKMRCVRPCQSSVLCHYSDCLGYLPCSYTAVTCDVGPKSFGSGRNARLLTRLLLPPSARRF